MIPQNGTPQPLNLLISVRISPGGRYLVSKVERLGTSNLVVPTFTSRSSNGLSSEALAKEDNEGLSAGRPNSPGVTVVVPVQGTAVTGAVNSQSISVEGPNVLGVKLPGVSVDNPLGGIFGGSPKSTDTPNASAGKE